MPTVLITGANRGLGLEFARQYAADGWQVIAANPVPFLPKDFASLGYDVTELHYDPLDDASALALAKRLTGRPIDVAIFSLEDPGGEDLPPEKVAPDNWRPVMLANTYGPLHLAGLLEPNLMAGSNKALVAVSSLASSIERQTGSRHFAYRASKAALNQMWRSLAVEWRDWGCLCLLLSPDRSAGDASGEAASKEAAKAMRKAIAEVTPEHSGLHWGQDGTIVPW